MYFGDELGLLDVQYVEVLIESDAKPMKLGAHRPIGEKDTVSKSLSNIAVTHV
jgi:hypothetical protein